MRFILGLLLFVMVSCCGIREEKKDGYAILHQNGGPDLGYTSVDIISHDGYSFKDNNRNGSLDPYEDWRLSPADRAADLAAQLPAEYLSGLLTNGHTVNVPGISSMSVSGITYNGKPYAESGAEPSDICDRLRDAIVNFDTRQILLAHSDGPGTIARWNNKVQALCESLPFGIPSCNSTDPRNEIRATDEYNAGSGGVCSQWPTPLGLAATFDTTVVRGFASAVKREYLALGFHTALSPQADLATDPRWRRVPGTFGENPELVKSMAATYVHTMQPEVSCIIKHWPGGGTGEGGRDAHLSIGKYGVFPGGAIETHMDAFCLDAAGIMPYYTVSYGQDPSGENVGNSYSSYIVDTLLRKQYGYSGIVCTDWGIVPDYNGDPLTTGGKCYGVENLSVGERILKAMEAGVDEFGGSVKASEIMQAWTLWCRKYGEASARTRWEKSARKVLETFFRTGLFENPYVDPANAEAVLSDPEAAAQGEDAQRRSIVMLKNSGHVLPVIPSAEKESDRAKVYIPLRQIPGVYSMTGRLKKEPYVGYSVDTAEVAKHYTIVSSPEEADFALVAITEPEGGVGYRDGKYMPISLQYSPYTASRARAVSIAGGDPAEKGRNRSYRGRHIEVENATDLALVRETKVQMGSKPVVVLLQTTRPVVMEFEPWADAILVAFGVRSKAFMEIVSGAFEPTGRLPMQFPANMDTVEQQLEDVPQDMQPYLDADGNLYDYGFGLGWSAVKNTPGLVAFWDFGGTDYLRAFGNDLFLLRSGSKETEPSLVAEGPLSGHSLYFDGKDDWLYIPYKETASLNVKGNQVTVVAWVKWIPGQVGFVGGMWNEYEGGGKRQYGLFVSLPHYNGANQVCGHISKTGKPTPPFPYSIDYSASAQEVPAEKWCQVAFTYDGEYIRSFLDGEFESREPELIDHTKGFEGYPDGLVQSKNPYYFPEGIGDNGSDFTVGAVSVKGKIGNHFHGLLGGLAVYDRALSESELRAIKMVQ